MVSTDEMTGVQALEPKHPDLPMQPGPTADAYSAVTVFANAQLGMVIEPLYAGEATGDIVAQMQLLPPEIQGFVLNALMASGDDYWTLVNGGAAGVMVADAVTTEQLTAELSSNATGLYTLRVEAAMPTNASEALNLITHVYPALTGLAFAEIADIEDGMAFTATAASMGVDPFTGASLSAPKIVYAGVIDVDGQQWSMRWWAWANTTPT